MGLKMRVYKILMDKHFGKVHFKVVEGGERIKLRSFLEK
jgi:hypothetical protein